MSIDIEKLPAKRRFDRIYDIGCIACIQADRFSQCQAHHLNLDGKAGQVRRGDRYTIGLCPWHHQGQAILGRTVVHMTATLGPSLAHNSRAFREMYGNDTELLAIQDDLIAARELRVSGR